MTGRTTPLKRICLKSRLARCRSSPSVGMSLSYFFKMATPKLGKRTHVLIILTGSSKHMTIDSQSNSALLPKRPKRPSAPCPPGTQQFAILVSVTFTETEAYEPAREEANPVCGGCPLVVLVVLVGDVGTITLNPKPALNPKL